MRLVKSCLDIGQGDCDLVKLMWVTRMADRWGAFELLVGKANTAPAGLEWFTYLQR